MLTFLTSPRETVQPARDYLSYLFLTNTFGRLKIILNDASLVHSLSHPHDTSRKLT